MRCPSCNHDNPADASFCEECGAKLELICPACKASVSPGARFCKKCGTAIGPTKAAASTTVSSPKSQIIVAADGAASEAIEGERKTVTALFADIKGSTELMEDLDPEEARSDRLVLPNHFNCSRGYLLSCSSCCRLGPDIRLYHFWSWLRLPRASASCRLRSGSSVTSRRYRF